MDTATEARIRTMLKEELPEMTKIIIAQRISSVRNADQILILDDGRVSDIGTHEELLKRNESIRKSMNLKRKGRSFNGKISGI